MPAYSSGSPRSGMLEVGISLVLRDKFSNPIRESQAAFKQLHNEAKRANAANLQAAYSIADTLQSYSVGMMSGMVGAITQGAEFIDTMTTVRAITEATDAQYSQLSETAQSLGLATMFTSQEIASGMKYLAMAGNKAQEINDMIEGAAYVAGATGMALGGKGGAADMITNVMKAFRIEGKAGADMVGDQLTKATLSANISMMDLAESIKYSAADLTSLKRELPEVAAMIGTLGNAGIQGSMAGVALSNMARYLNKALTDTGSKQYAALSKLGITIDEVTDQNGDLISFYDILSKIKDATANMTSMQRNTYLNTIFGVRGFRGANALMNDLEGLRQLHDDITNNSKGYAKSITEMRMNSLAGAIEILKGSFENLVTTFVSALDPLKYLFKAVAKVLDVIRGIFKIPVVSNIIAIGAVAIPLVTWIISSLVKMRVRFMELKNDGLISAKNMFSVLRGGWSGAIIQAKEYAAILRQINGMHAGVGMPFSMLSANQRKQQMAMMAAAGYSLHMNRAGYGFLRYTDPATGKVTKLGAFTDKNGNFIDNSKAQRHMYTTFMAGDRAYLNNWMGFGPNPPTPPTKGGRGYGWKQITSGKRFLAAARGSVRSAGAGIGRAAAGFGKAFVGGAAALAGGLPGILAMLAITTIPAAVKAINDSVIANHRLKAEMEKNTASVYTLAGKFETESARRAAGKSLTLNQELTVLHNTILELAEAIREGRNIPKQEITLMLDGKVISQAISNDKSNGSFNRGTKGF